MILAIDIGNTHTIFALYDGSDMLGKWRLATDYRRTADEFILWIERFLARIKQQPVALTQVVLSCVVPQTMYAITSAIKENWQLKPLIIDSSVMASIGLQIKTERPDEVGADRMINALAVWDMFRQAAIIVDFGTATTFDVIDECGAYCGGVIAPGINLSLEALHRAAAQLPDVAIMKPSQAIGRSTEQAMQSGIFYGYLGLIERIIDEIRAEMPCDIMQIIATGGLAGLFYDYSNNINHIIPDLTMNGLRIAAQKYNAITNQL